MEHSVLGDIAFETERLRVRRFQEKDGDCLFAMMKDAETCSDDGGYDPIEQKDAAFDQLVRAFAGEPDRFVLALKESDIAIGTLHLMDPIPERAVPALEIGYCVCPAFRRRGYASEAAAALIRHLHQEMGIPLITAGVFDFNLKSQRMLEKLGFEREGVTRYAIDHPIHGMTDMICYVHLQKE